MKFFSRKPQDGAFDVTLEDQLAEQQVAPGTQLHYDSRLIQRLRDHAIALQDLLARSGSAARASKFDEAGNCLRRFRLTFNEHLLDKNLRLYTYLGCCLKSDPEQWELMREMRREAADVSRQTTHFLTRYSELGIHEENGTALVEELQRIADMLRQCFEREDRSLYAMYQPPQRYQVAPARTSPRPQACCA